MAMKTVLPAALALCFRQGDCYTTALLLTLHRPVRVSLVCGQQGISHGKQTQSRLRNTWPRRPELEKSAASPEARAPTSSFHSDYRCPDGLSQK